MKRVLIFGIGRNYRFLKNTLYARFHVIGLVDNSTELQGKYVDGIKVGKITEYSPALVDYVIVTPVQCDGISRQIIEAGFSETQIVYGDIDNLWNYLGVRLAFFLYGGMGDFLIARNYLAHMKEKFGLNDLEVIVHLHSAEKKSAMCAFDGCENVIQFQEIDGLDIFSYQKYDVVIHQCIFPYVEWIRGSFLEKKNKLFLEYLLKLQRFGFENYPEGFAYSRLFCKSLEMLFASSGGKYHNFFDVFKDLGAGDVFLYSLPIHIDECEYLERIKLQKKRYITIDAGQNSSFLGKGNTRLWNAEAWRAVACELKNKYPEFKLVLVGTSTWSLDKKIPVDINLAEKTSFEEIKVLLKNAAIHIDYDGGLVHVRHIINGGPSIVLFGPTSATRHTYEENVAIQKNVCKTHPCEWKTSDWIYNCAMGEANPPCMMAITPQDVVNRVDELMKK